MLERRFLSMVSRCCTREGILTLGASLIVLLYITYPGTRISDSHKNNNMVIGNSDIRRRLPVDLGPHDVQWNAVTQHGTSMSVSEDMKTMENTTSYGYSTALCGPWVSSSARGRASGKIVVENAGGKSSWNTVSVGLVNRERLTPVIQISGTDVHVEDQRYWDFSLSCLGVVHSMIAREGDTIGAALVDGILSYTLNGKPYGEPTSLRSLRGAEVAMVVALMAGQKVKLSLCPICGGDGKPRGLLDAIRACLEPRDLQDVDKLVHSFLPCYHCEGTET